MPINPYSPYFLDKAEVFFFPCLNLLYGTLGGSPRAFSPFQTKTELFLKSAEAFLLLLWFGDLYNTGRLYDSHMQQFLTLTLRDSGEKSLAAGA